MSEAAAESKPLSLCKTELESSQFLQQHLQQISLPQDNTEPSTKEATTFSALIEGQQEPLSLVKNRQPKSWQTVGVTHKCTVHKCQVRTFFGLTLLKQNFMFILASKSSSHGSREQRDWSEVWTSTMGPDVFQVCRQLGRGRGCRRWSVNLQKTHHQLSEGQGTGWTQPSVRPLLPFLFIMCFHHNFEKYTVIFLCLDLQNQKTTQYQSCRATKLTPLLCLPGSTTSASPDTFQVRKKDHNNHITQKDEINAVHLNEVETNKRRQKTYTDITIITSSTLHQFAVPVFLYNHI